MGDFFLYSDEAGDLGIEPNKRPGTTLFYVPFLLLLNKKYQEEFYQILKTSFLEHAKMTVTEWKKLPSKVKNSDSTLSNIVNGFLKKIGDAESKKKEIIYLMSACILDKSEISRKDTPMLYSNRLFRMAWTYGLAFKRLGVYLEKAQHSVDWIIDQNASRDILNLKRYINEYLPDKRKFLKRYRGPEIGKKAETRFIKSADFFAGLTRVIGENIIDNCFKWADCPKRPDICKKKCAFLRYPITSQNIFRLFSCEIQRRGKLLWNWRGFLFYPIEKGKKYLHIFPRDEFTRY